MNDPRYPESSAYHEAGHIVIAAAQSMRLSRHGIRVDSEGGSTPALCPRFDENSLILTLVRNVVFI